MPTEVVMPQMGESITEGTLTKWLKQVGETIARDEPLFEISTDKVDAEIPSPAAGVLKEIKAKEGDTVAINTVVAVLDAEGSAPAPAASAPAAAPAAEAPKAEAAPAPAAGGVDVLMPQMGESITEGTITKWLKKVGDTVQRDEPIFEISTDKVDAEIPSPASGTLTEIKAKEGETVSINTVVAVIGGAASAPAAAPAASAPAASGHAPAAPASTGGAATEVTMPQMGESITEGTITKWLKKVGDTVQRDEPIFEISTDKVDAEIPSPAAGTLTEIRAKEGETVAINTVVAILGGAGSGSAPAPQASAPAATQAAPAQAQPAAASAGEAPRSSPLVRKMAKDNGVDLATAGINGSGSAGRITKNDMVGYLQNGGKPAGAPAQSAAPTATGPAPATASLSTLR